MLPRVEDGVWPVIDGLCPHICLESLVHTHTHNRCDASLTVVRWPGEGSDVEVYIVIISLQSVVGFCFPLEHHVQQRQPKSGSCDAWRGVRHWFHRIACFAKVRTDISTPSTSKGSQAGVLPFQRC